jgi:hypothetical protein
MGPTKSHDGDKHARLSLFSLFIGNNSSVLSAAAATLLLLLTLCWGSNAPLTTTTTTTIFSLFVDWYMNVLERFPLLTKSVTTGTIQLVGDCGAQYYEHYKSSSSSRAKNNNNNTSNIDDATATTSTTTTNTTTTTTTTTTISDRSFFHNKYSLRRGLTLFADGLLLSGPLLSVCFDYMEHVLPTTTAAGDDDSDGLDGTGSSLLPTVVHVLINDYIIDSVYIAVSFPFTCIAEGYTSYEEILQIFRNDFVSTVTASWCTSLGLIPIEIVCFGYLPLSLRVLSMNFVDLFWGAIVSYFSHRSRNNNNNSSSNTTASSKKES